MMTRAMRRQLLAGLVVAWLAQVVLLWWEFAPGGASLVMAPAQLAALVVVSAAIVLVRSRPLDEGDDDGGSRD